MKDYTGIKINRLTALNFVKRENGNTYWLFKCDCGNEKIIRSNNVFRKGGVNPIESCGCIVFERKRPIDSIKKQIFREYVKSSKKRGYDFLLSYDNLIGLINKNCHYCGTEPLKKQYNKKTRDEDCFLFWNGIDRKDNEIGYTIDNSVTCCTTCNYAKRATSYNDFISWLNRVKEYR